MKNEILTWLIQTPVQLMALAALAMVLACALLQWRAIARLRRELQDDLAEMTSRLTMVAQVSAGALPGALPVLQPASQSVRPPTASLSSDVAPSAQVVPQRVEAVAMNEHRDRQDYVTAQRLAARGAHPEALVERCGLSAAEAHILVAMHAMKPAKG